MFITCSLSLKYFFRPVIFPPISADPPDQSSKPVVFEIGKLSLLSVQSEGVGGRPTGTGKVVTLSHLVIISKFSGKFLYHFTNYFILQLKPFIHLFFCRIPPEITLVFVKFRQNRPLFYFFRLTQHNPMTALIMMC